MALIGRNGTGKSTLLRILSGDLAPDAGAIWREPGLTTARLAQQACGPITRHVFEAVAGGLGDLQALLTAYHRAAHDAGRSARDDSSVRTEFVRRGCRPPAVGYLEKGQNQIAESAMTSSLILRIRTRRVFTSWFLRNRLDIDGPVSPDDNRRQFGGLSVLVSPD